MAAPPAVAVVGACFMDESLYMSRVPNDGETVECGAYEQSFGGKAGNQSVMLGHLGTPVRLLAMLGPDANGNKYQDHLSTSKVDTSFIRRVDRATGFAHIWVSDTGDNRIVIYPGAAAQFTEEQAKALTEAGCLEGVRILLCQNEIPFAATLHFLKTAHAAGVTTIFNPSPAMPLTRECFEAVSILVVNEHEAAVICESEPVTPQTAGAAARRLRSLGARGVVITLGSAGCLLLEAGEGGAAEPLLLPCPAVERVVDTSGAGDCWVGCLAHFLARGKPMAEGCRRANTIAALSVTGKGTQKSFPFARDLSPDLLD